MVLAHVAAAEAAEMRLLSASGAAHRCSRAVCGPRSRSALPTPSSVRCTQRAGDRAQVRHALGCSGARGVTGALSPRLGGSGIPVLFSLFLDSG